MKGLKTALFGITVLAVLAFAGVGAAVASSGSSASPDGGGKRSECLGSDHRRQPRPHAVPLRERQARRKRLLGRVPGVLAAVAHKRSADRDQGSQALSARQHPTS